MKNLLENQTSPYLLQHSENPVYWYPWCEQAFEAAKQQDKPIFLSIGYSTCHWCHVMARESFENIKTAEILNENFICIKVDREERPDIDSVYMSVCQMLTGSGGWPMSIFMSWDKKPFFAGTYFPPDSRYGTISFNELLTAIAKQWKNNRPALLSSADKIIDRLKEQDLSSGSQDYEHLDGKAYRIFSDSFDVISGGFGKAPKFPMPHNLLFLMLFSKVSNNSNALKMAEKTLVQMRKGGIFDQIGYGFSRYSTDENFLVPHFEKMLYDNALLIMAYSSLYSLTKDFIYLDTAQKTAKYILREMTSSSGGFFSAQDADSDGAEGSYYTFTPKEISDILGDMAEDFNNTFDISKKGNFEGKSIPNLLKSNFLNNDFEQEIEKLYDYRKKRLSLSLDDKILISSNSMTIAAFSMLYRLSDNEKYLNEAKKAQAFIEKNMCDGLQLYTSFRQKRSLTKGFLDDYAFYICALIELYNSTLDLSFLEKAELFCEYAVKKFSSSDSQGFFLCQNDSDELFINPKESYDGATPSGNSVMAYNFVRLYQLTQNKKYLELWESQDKFMSEKAQSYPANYSMFLLAKLIYENPPMSVTIALESKENKTELLKKPLFFANVVMVYQNDSYPLINKKTTYYVCQNRSCLPPSNSL